MRPVTEDEFRAEFESYGLDADRYYDPWRLLIILWYSIWWTSEVDWSPYRRRIWSLFGEWIASAARRSNDLNRFLSLFARVAALRYVGRNEEERQRVLEFLALPEERQRRIVAQLREDTPILLALVMEFTRKHKFQEEETDDDAA